MRKTFFLMATAIALVACGTAKNTTSATQDSATAQESLGTLIQKSQEQLFAEDPDADNLRAWASYNGFENQNLESFAATAARANLASEIATLVSTATDLYENGARIDNKSVDGMAENVKMAESKAENGIKAAAKELMRGSRIVMSNRYRQKDGTVTCYAAVEMNLKGVLNNIKNNASIQEAISQSRREQIDFNSKKFEEAMQSAFEELKEAKKQK